MEEAGRRGGTTRAQQQEGTEAGEEAKRAGKMTVQEAGRRGGEAAKQTLGEQGYSEIGRMGAEERAKRDEMHEFADEAESRVPDEYKEVRQEAFDRTVNIAKTIVPECAEILLGAGFSPSEARSKIESDFGQIWRPRTIMRWLPSDLKDAERALAGEIGGKETATRPRGRPKGSRNKTTEAWERGQGREETQRPVTNKYRIYAEDFDQIRRAMERAAKLQVEYIELELDKDYHITWIEVPEPRTTSAA